MTDENIKAAIKFEEGLRLDAYPDSLGNLTIGYGHRLYKGSSIPQKAAEIIFEADYETAATGYDKLDLDLDLVRRGAIIDMIFNMGLFRVKRFEHMLFALREHDYVRAANELMDSEYARQVPQRAKRNRDRILRGA